MEEDKVDAIGNVEASFYYYHSDVENPEAQNAHVIRFKSGPVELVQDVRLLERTFDLDKDGFTWIPSPATFRRGQFGSDNDDSTYSNEVESLLKEILKPDNVWVFSVRVRRFQHPVRRMH